jgi:hypothetical protein
MNIRTAPLLLALIGLVAGSNACSSIDAERDHLKGTLDRAHALATEITSWHETTTSTASIPSGSIEQVDTFRERAEDLLDTVTGTSNEATTGVDLSGVQRALESISEFDTSDFANASDTGRQSLLAQFAARAQSLREAIEVVRVS